VTRPSPPAVAPRNLPLFLLALAALTVAVYWPTLTVPFYLDDFPGIVENPRLHDVTDLQAIWQFAPQRFVGSLSFAANYALHGNEVLGYHVANLAIHLLAGLALFALSSALVRSPVVDAESRPWVRWVPLVATALFLLHPLQTQAVTYVVQRYASLAAMFYLGALAAYAWARLRRWHWLLIVALLFAALALFTKQNAATVIGAAVLVELLFFRRLGRGGVVLVAAATIGLAAGGLWLLGLEQVDVLTRETRDISRTEYFATQTGVLWRYVALFLLPLQQRLEYDIALVTAPLPAWVFVAAGAHLAAILAGFLAWRRAPLVAFGILFFYLAHLVESSVLPITDLAFEHRTYLPNAGLATLVAAVFAWLVFRAEKRTTVLSILVLALAVGAWLTFERNRLWGDVIGFLQQETALSPNKERAWTSLGKELLRRQRYEEALKALGQALNLSRTGDGLEVQVPTLLNTVFALHYTGQHQKGFEIASLIPLKELSPLDKGRLYEVRGMALAQLKATVLARRELERARRHYPMLTTVAWLSYVDLLEQKWEAAAERATAVLAEMPDHPVASDVQAKAIEALAGRDPGDTDPGPPAAAAR
jgi:hypothetical protein